MYKEKDYNENKDYQRYNGEFLFEKVVITTNQIPYDKDLFDKYDEADEVSKDYLFIGKFTIDVELV